jgi:REP element-mobilizing transposase RayT
MQRKHESFAEGEFYHIYNRGVDKREIFSSVSDYDRFVKLLYLCNSSEIEIPRYLLRQRQSLTETMLVNKGNELVGIGAYVLMPNHFHILLTPKTKDGVSIFMKRICTAYSKYYNLNHKRSGALFQGPFKSTHANKDKYLKYLYSYIHLNPVKIIKEESNWKEEGIKDLNNVKKFLQEFEYSSYLDYTGINRIQSKILDKSIFPEYLPDAESNIKEINEWLDFKTDTHSVKDSH